MANFSRSGPPVPSPAQEVNLLCGESCKTFANNAIEQTRRPLKIDSHVGNLVSGLPAKVGNKKGAVYLYPICEGTVCRDNNGPMWASLDAGTESAPGDLFGASVALDGTNLVVGAWGPATYAGAAYVFDLSGEGSFTNFQNHQWWDTRRQKLNPISGLVAYESFGTAVAIAGDFLVVGAPSWPYSAAPRAGNGRAVVFKRTAGVWSEVHDMDFIVTAGPDTFGRSVAISSTLVVVGDDHGNEGSVYSWTLPNLDTMPFSKQHYTTYPAVAVHDGNIVIGLFGLNKVEIHTSYFGVGTSNFGVSVALSADVLAVGDNEAIYVYTSCDPGAFWNDQTAACESCGLGTYSAGGVGAQCGN